MSLHEAFYFIIPLLWKKQIRENILGSVYGEDQLSSDKYIVACTFLSRIQRDIYHCSWGEGGREGGGGGESAPLPQCAFLFFFLFLTPITSRSVCGKHPTSSLFNPFQIYNMLFFFHIGVSLHTPPHSLLHRLHVFVTSTPLLFYPGSHSLVSPDNSITQTEYVAGKM